MPAAFIGHGSPMNALGHNVYTDAWASFARSLPTPRAILAISAHWYTNGTAVTSMDRPPTIHDFAGFPENLQAVEYPASGDPELAAEVVGLLSPDVVDESLGWGLDHGTWSVLVHMFPDADVPVVQLSIDATLAPQDHVERGAALSPLADNGVLVICSGNVVHNLRLAQWDDPDGATDWTMSFDESARELMTGHPGSIASLGDHPAYNLAAPTPEHLLPLYYLAGMARAVGQTTEVLTSGYAMGSLSMASFAIPGRPPEAQ